jgi:hypothetical protein
MFKTNLPKTDVSIWFPKESLNTCKKESLEYTFISRNEKKEIRTSQRDKTLKLFELIRNSEIGGDKFYLGPYGYKRSKFRFFEKRCHDFIHFQLVVLFKKCVMQIILPVADH